MSRGIGYLWEGLVLKESKKGRTTAAGVFVFPFVSFTGTASLLYLCTQRGRWEVFDATFAARRGFEVFTDMGTGGSGGVG